MCTHGLHDPCTIGRVVVGGVKVPRNLGMGKVLLGVRKRGKR